MRSFFFLRWRSSRPWSPLRDRALAVAGALVFAAAPGLAVAAPQGSAAASSSASGSNAWLGEELPLPLAVRTPADLAVKQVAERQYLIFNLIAGGKLAWDGGDYATAAGKWEALLRLPGLDPDVDRVIRPLAREARTRAGGTSGLPPAPLSGAAGPTTSVASAGDEGPSRPGGGSEARIVVSVSGTLSGGGALGPGGAVIWLKRLNGDTPRPAPARGKVINQRNKSFVPHVLAVPVGSKVDFRNEDAIFHNVFSLSKPNDFDTGLYRQGASYSQVFKKAGPVQILCNIHSSMLGYVYVVDTPYYTQADGAGSFMIKGVPIGDYELTIWHETASKVHHQKVIVGADGVRGLSIKVAGDRRAPTFLPDKSGKPRQAQLGY
jgi:plastocyanin